MLEDRTKSVLKGLIFSFLAFIFYFFIPYFLYNFAMGILRDVFILYVIAPPSYHTFLYAISPPVFTFMNLNFGSLILLGLPISVAAFFTGVFKSETVGHALARLALLFFFAVWFLLGVGTLGITTFYMYMQLPVISLLPVSPYVEQITIYYISPWIFDIQGILNISLAVILLSGLIYLAELGIGISSKDYWRYWGK
ncbi:MAG: hypothetical protein ACETWM_12485 [Candidatus Lokiarchaeia archaeon]